MENQILDDLGESDKGKKFKSISEFRVFLKSLHRESQEQLEEGKTKTEIFEGLIVKHGTRYEKHIANQVGFAITKKQEREYGNWITILLVIYVLSLLAQLMIAKNYYVVHQNVPGLLFSAGIMILIDVFIIRRLKRRWMQILSSIIVIGIIKTISILLDLDKAYYGEWIYGYIGMILIAVVIAIIMRRRLFPGYGLNGPKKNEFGTYKFK